MADVQDKDIVDLEKKVENLEVDEPEPPITSEQVQKVLEGVIRKKNLGKFFPQGAAEFSDKAAKMVNALRQKDGCSPEIANQFATLTLYELAILIDDSDSMVYAQNGERIKTLQEILNNIADIYGLAKDTGISTVRFLNAAKGKKNVTAKTVKTVIKGHDYGGVTRIGTELRKKILDRFVLGKEMKKPLLVLVITDGAAEGESQSLLGNVIKNCILELQRPDNATSKGPNSVAFQFSRVGNDKGALKLLKDLDDDKDVGDYVDCLPMENQLEDVNSGEPGEKWILMSKLLLGAISEYWDGAQEVDNKQDGTFEARADDDESDVEDEAEDDDDDE